MVRCLTLMIFPTTSFQKRLSLFEISSLFVVYLLSPGQLAPRVSVILCMRFVIVSGANKIYLKSKIAGCRF